MPLSKFIITEIQNLISDIRLIGHYEVDLITVRQVIVRLGKPTDLAMKKGGGGWELEIQLPPLTYQSFVSLINNKPTECYFDSSESATEFNISCLFKNNKRTVTTTFSIK